MLYKYLKLFLCALASSSSTPISFISYGDWGAHNSNQETVANTISQYTETYNSSFNLVLGNNFYENGVTSITDPLWNTNYKNIYKNNNSWYVILGNHDYYGNTSAQIAYTGMDGRWNMPANNYVIIRDNIKIIFLDTQQLDPICSDVPIDITSSINKKNIYKWLIRELRTIEQIKIVVGHAGIYSAGEYGNCKELIENLFPLLNKYDISLYLHGHSHIFEYNRHESLDMIGCGTASTLAKYNDLKFSSDHTKYYTLNYGFCFHTIHIVNKNMYIKTQFINQYGDILFEHKSNDLPYRNNSSSKFASLFKYLFIIFFIITFLYCCHAFYMAQLYSSPKHPIYDQENQQRYPELPRSYDQQFMPKYKSNFLGNKNPQINPLIETHRDVL
jgi:acid phosphatase